VCSSDLDILWASSLTLWFGRDLAAMLRFVASGPFPAASDWGLAGAFLGLAVHFSLMGIMAAIFMIAWTRTDQLQRHPFLGGMGYGLLTYAVLDFIVVPLRFPTAWPPSTTSIVTQLFAHLMLVGLVFAMIARQGAAASSEFGTSEGRARPIAESL